MSFGRDPAASDGALYFLAWSKSQKERYISGRSGWLCAHCFSPCTKVCVLSRCDNATMVRVGVPDGAVTEYRRTKSFFGLVADARPLSISGRPSCRIGPFYYSTQIPTI